MNKKRWIAVAIALILFVASLGSQFLSTRLADQTEDSLSQLTGNLIPGTSLQENVMPAIGLRFCISKGRFNQVRAVC
jgi:protease-4